MPNPVAASVSRAKRTLRNQVMPRLGVQPTWNLWLRSTRWPEGATGMLRERREAGRLQNELGRRPTARVATVIPTHRRPDLLQAAVGSALEQTFTDHVVIVVDDGGGLPALPRDERLVAVSLSRRSGRVGLVRNVGIRLSDSEYVAFLDDDNRWLPQHLERCVETLDGGVDVVYTAVRRVRADGSEVDVLAWDFDRSAMRRERSADTSSMVVRRRPGLRFSTIPRSSATCPEDFELLWRLSRRARVLHVPEVTVEYLVHQGSYLSQWSPDQLGHRSEPPGGTPV